MYLLAFPKNDAYSTGIKTSKGFCIVAYMACMLGQAVFYYDLYY